MDLKSFREDKLKMTLVDFAALIDEEQSDILKWEKTGEPPLKVLEKIAQKTATDFNTLLGYQKPVPKPLEVDNSWLKADFTKRTLTDYITTVLDGIDIPDEQRKAYVDDLRIGITSNIVKPQVTIVGRSDTGKSTLINALLGAEKMPTSWTPTTSIAVYIKHIADKPAFIEDDVWVFTNHNGDEDLWDARRLYDETYCRAWKIGAGNPDILHSFGTRQGENYHKNAGSAVMFVDAPVLSTCDIVDLPGFGTETESDNNITFKATQRADVVIYLSQANGFMRIEDIEYLKRNISELPVWEKDCSNPLKPLANLFVVASQAHTINNGNREQLKNILDIGCINLLKTLSDGYWTNRKNASGYTSEKYGKNELRSRFFVYTTDIPDLCTRFNDELKAVVEALPLIINERAKSFVRDYVSTRKPNLVSEIEKYEGIVAERDRYISLLSEIDNNEMQRVQDNDKRKNELRTNIREFCNESVNEFADYSANFINTDAIMNALKNRKVKNKKEDVEQFGSWLQSELQTHCESILSEKSEKLKMRADNYVKSFSDSISSSFISNGIKIDFDARWAFASSLAKFGMFGGFGAFLAGVAAFGVGTISFIAGIGGTIALGVLGLGPIGLAVGLLTAATLGVIKLFGGGWEKNVAKKIVEAFDKNDINGKYRKGIREYWTQTEKAFDHAADTLDAEWDAYVKDLHETVESYDINEIQHKIASLRVLSDFFDNIPL